MLTDEIKSIIQEAYSNFLKNKGLKARYGQRLMIAEIAKFFARIKTNDKNIRTSDPAIIAIEAGTGTGKTVAYTIAATPYAQWAQKQLIISTATIALQEQILYKDLPDIAKNSSLHFTYALAKGRGRYLCLVKLDRLLQEEQHEMLALFEQQDETSISKTHRVLFQSMLNKLSGNHWDGDRDSWIETIDDTLWSQLTTEHNQCTNRLCQHFQQCPFFKARNQLNNVDIIITNHDMVLSDLNLGGGVILPAPQDSLYIFDEGHHLPDKAIKHFSHHIQLQTTIDWSDQIAKTIHKLIKQYPFSYEIGRRLEALPPLCERLKEQLRFFFNACKPLLEVTEQENHLEYTLYRFQHGVVPDELITIGIELKKQFAELITHLTYITAQLKESVEGKITLPLPQYVAEEWFIAFGSLLKRSETNWSLWSLFTTTDASNTPPTARWINLVISTSHLDIEVCASPIMAANTLRTTLWNTAHGALITSATLTALGRFDRLLVQSGLSQSTTTHQVPSPFNYEKMGILQIPNIQADPRNAILHTQAIIELLPELITKNQGTLVLFSSKKQMLDVFHGLTKDYQDVILVQNTVSKQQLVTQHKMRIDNNETSVIFGLASFAEGVDLPGQYCEHVIIAKIPFAVPDNPIEATLAEWLEQQGKNPFMEITVPDASLKLIQACGRLIRTEQDTGIITILDRRIINSSYGKALLNALPPFKKVIK